MHWLKGEQFNDWKRKQKNETIGNQENSARFD
jgi:hypothetical protein